MTVDYTSQYCDFSYLDRIRYLRLRYGYTQQFLSDLLHINRVQLSRIENGREDFKLWMLVAYCGIFNVSSDYILFGVTDQSIPVVQCKIKSP